MKYLLIMALCGLGLSHLAAAEMDGANITRGSIQYSKSVLLANEFFDHQQIERLNLKRWINKTGIRFGTEYALTTELTPEGLVLEFTVKGPVYLVTEFYKYILSNVDLLVLNRAGQIESSQLEKYKKSSQNLLHQVESEIQALSGEAVVRDECQLTLAQ